MSDAPQTEKAAAPAATVEKPAAPAEPPFTADDLQSSTARFTHKAWYLYYNNRKDFDFIRQAMLRVSLQARSAEGAQTLEGLLLEAGATAMSRQKEQLAFNGTFEMVQKVIKHAETYKVDAVRV